MAKYFCKNDKLVAEPELIKAHGQAKPSQCAIGQQRDDGNVKDFLFSVGKYC